MPSPWIGFRTLFLGTGGPLAWITILLGAGFCALSVVLALWAVEARKGMQIE